MKKFIIPSAIIATLIIGIFYIFNNSSKNTQTNVLESFSDWKTYAGNNVGFNLKYPSDWTVDDSFPDSVSLMSSSGNAFNAYRTKASSKKQSLTQWLKAKDKESKEVMGGQYNDYVISSKKTKIAKMSAIRRKEHADAAGFDFIQTYAKKDDYFYTFSLGVGASGVYTNEDEKVYDKILSTIKFIK